MFPWCSGYHVRLTRARSPVRSRAETSLFFPSVRFFYIFFFTPPLTFFFLPTFTTFLFIYLFFGFQRFLAILLFSWTVKKALPERKHLRVLQLQHTYLPAFRFHHLIIIKQTNKQTKKQTKNVNLDMFQLTSLF